MPATFGDLAAVVERIQSMPKFMDPRISGLLSIVFAVLAAIVADLGSLFDFFGVDYSSNYVLCSQFDEVALNRRKLKLRSFWSRPLL